MEKHFALDCNCCGLMEGSVAIFVITNRLRQGWDSLTRLPLLAASSRVFPYPSLELLLNFMEDDNTGKTELNWRRRETARMTSFVLNLVNDLHMSMMLMKIQLGASRGWILTEQREKKREEERWNSMIWWTYQPEDWMVLHFRLAEQEGCIIQDKSSIHSICAVLWQWGFKWCATSMAWQSCWRRGCQTKWPQTNFSTWFNRLYWNPGRTCFYPWFVFCMWFKLVQKKICIGSSCIGSSHGVPWRNLAWQLMSHIFLLTSLLLYLWRGFVGHRHLILWQKILTGSKWLH